MANETTVQNEQYSKSVERMAGYMLQKLNKNTHKGHWSGNPLDYFFDRIQDEIDELHIACRNTDAIKEVFREAADVANIAMMIAENYQEEWRAELWLEILKDNDVNYGLSHAGISYHSEEDLQRARELAKEHGLEDFLPAEE